MGVYDARGPLAHKKAPSFFRDERDEAARCGVPALAEFWNFFHFACLMSDTMLQDRALGAFGLFGSTDQSAEFHQGLVEMGAT